MSMEQPTREWSTGDIEKMLDLRPWHLSGEVEVAAVEEMALA